MKTIRLLAQTVLLLCVLLLAVSLPLMAQEMDHAAGEPRPETDTPSPIALDPSRGADIGFVYEAFLSPQQEGGEEEDTPAFIPPQFRSTAPSIPREERPDRGHAVIAFTHDLSRAYVHLTITDVDLSQVVMLHLHCGRPGQLGPIIVDFATIGALQTYLADGTMSVEVRNHDIEAVTDSASLNPVDGFTLGCPITPAFPLDKVRTIGGLQLIAEQGELYFNLHTAGQTYFGNIRGQFSRVDSP